MSNHGNFIGSLGAVVRWLGARAEALGVKIYPGFAATELLIGDKGEVLGVATGDMGIGRDGKPKAGFTRGMELRGKYVLLAEGARGSLSKQAIARYRLDSASEPQKYGIGLKELWQVSDDQFSPGLVQHSFGWPLSKGTSGGSFLYHYGDRLVSVGFVVHLNYKNPTLSPFDEFQRFKTHPLVRGTFAGGKRIAYGARAIAAGGWQSAPKLVFPGGALIGCAAGFVNFARIKGSHNAILSGMLAAEKVREALVAGRAHDELTDYENSWRGSDIGHDLYKVRNVKPLWSRFGVAAGVALGGLDMWTNELFNASIFGALKHGKPDSDTLRPISEVAPIVYPKPDGVLTFDKASSVYLSNTNHEEDQPIHLRLHDPDAPIRDNLPHYGEPARLIVRLAFTRWFMPTRPVTKALASSSTRKIASIAKLATSRTRRKTSSGPRRKVGADRTIRICEGDTAQNRRFRLQARETEGFSFGCSIRLCPASKGRAFIVVCRLTNVGNR